MSIILLDEQDTTTSLEKEFINRLANKPYCTNIKDYGVYIRNKSNALSKKYIQPNTPWTLNWLNFDIDYPCVLETTFKEECLPTPNFIIFNRDNHRSHLLYGIKNPVHLSDNSSIEPIRYSHAIQIALRDKLKADIGHAGFIIKNPMHDFWETKELNQELWSLEELAQYLTLPNKIPKRELSIGLGRNCTLFEMGRYFAYSEVLKYKITANKDIFYNVVLDYLENQNKNFPKPLLFNEYKAIAKSITNWTWRYYGNKTTTQWFNYVKRTHSVELQSWRGKQNTPEQQAIKGRLGGLANTSEQQSIKGKIGGKNNTSKQQSIKGKQNTSEQQREKALKSAKIRFEGSNEQLKPWLSLGISRSYYYKQKKLGLIK